MRTAAWFVAAAALVVLSLGGGEALAGKPGGGGKPPGGGGGGGMADANVAFLFMDQATLSLWKGDASGNIAVAWPISVKGKPPQYNGWPVAQPAFGPSGTTKIAFDGNIGGVSGVYVADDFAGKNARLVVAGAQQSGAGGPNTQPSWSNGNAPNGQEMIVYVDDDASGHMQLFVTTLGGARTQITSDFSGAHPPLSTPRFNPVDASEVVFTAFRVMVVTLAATSNGVLYAAAFDEPIADPDLAGYESTMSNPTFSPDGAKILFSVRMPTASGATHTQLWIWDRSAAASTPLTYDLDVDVYEFCFLPNGRILYGAGGTYYTMDDDGGNISTYNAMASVSPTDLAGRR